MYMYMYMYIPSGFPRVPELTHGKIIQNPSNISKWLEADHSLLPSRELLHLPPLLLRYPFQPPTKKSPRRPAAKQGSVQRFGSQLLLLLPVAKLFEQNECVH